MRIGIGAAPPEIDDTIPLLGSPWTILQPVLRMYEQDSHDE